MEHVAPVERAIIPASSVHDLITAEGEARKEALLQVLRSYHGVKHIGPSQVERYCYEKWCTEHPELRKRVMEGAASPTDIVLEDGGITPPFISRYLSMDIGVDEELGTLSLIEKYFNERAKETSADAPEYIVESDQTKRTVRLGENKIHIIGRYDALLKKKVDKRPVVGIVEVKTRMHDYRENPADKTQLCLYSRMMPKVSVYALVERVRGKEDIKVTRWTYQELEDHWHSFVEPGLKKVYVELCALWRHRSEPTDDNYVGNLYAERLLFLIDHLNDILRVLDGQHGMPLLPGVLNELRHVVDTQRVESYTALCSRLTPEIVAQVQRKNIDFFRRNLLIIAATSSDYEDRIRTYTDGVADMLEMGCTEKTRDKIWEEVASLLSTV